MITFRPSEKIDKPATVVLISSDQVKAKKFAFKNSSLAGKVAAASAAGQFSGQNGEIFPVLEKSHIILLVGVTVKDSNPLTALRTAVRKAMASSFATKSSAVEIIPHAQDDDVIRAVIEGTLLGTYSWKKYKTKAKDDKSADKQDYFLAAPKKKEYEDAVAICQGVNAARDLVNDNADVVTSTLIEATIKSLIKGNKKISIEVLNRKEMEAKGLGLHLAVNQGSNKEPKLIIVKYQGAGPKEKYTALIGKGVTFDTGGLNLKPTGSMETMRMDMSGTAAVIGTLKNTIALGLKKNVLFVCAVAENAIGSGSFKPGDVFRAYNGKTVEINNTDAEGRLVLADAIAYVVKNYKPEEIIDIATLTGACVVALGHDYSGLISTNDKLAKQLIDSSKHTDDRVWRLPIYPEMKDSVKSNYADIRNTGFPRGAAGASTGAEFLRQFTDDTPWAHLDIAGTAYAEGSGRMYYGFGATGAGVRLLTDYLKNN